jgi:hypothetical protein
MSFDMRNPNDRAVMTNGAFLRQDVAGGHWHRTSAWQWQRDDIITTLAKPMAGNFHVFNGIFLFISEKKSRGGISGFLTLTTPGIFKPAFRSDPECRKRLQKSHLWRSPRVVFQRIKQKKPDGLWPSGFGFAALFQAAAATGSVAALVMTSRCGATPR